MGAEVIIQLPIEAVILESLAWANMHDGVGKRASSDAPFPGFRNDREDRAIVAGRRSVSTFNAITTKAMGASDPSVSVCCCTYDGHHSLNR